MITDIEMDTIASYMDDEIREDLNADLAPCSNEYFLTEYVKCDPDFDVLLMNEFNIDIDEIAEIH